jgi:hypothetical protein
LQLGIADSIVTVRLIALKRAAVDAIVEFHASRTEDD